MKFTTLPFSPILLFVWIDGYQRRFNIYLFARFERLSLSNPFSPHQQVNLMILIDFHSIKYHKK